MNMKRILTLLLALVFGLVARGQNLAGTYLYAQRENQDLYLDVYAPTPGSETFIGDKEKPTILFIFGGAFISGSRNENSHKTWYKLLNDNGYRVVAIDYRLGLKGVRMQFSLFKLTDTAKKTKHAVDLGVEDLFSAINYICDHARGMGIDPANIVVAGSSAGAMISLSAEYEICNGSPRAAVLPEGFNFAGVMSFAGAIMSDSGKPAYKREPCPQLLFHGTDDKIVNYKKLSLGNWGLFGTNVLADVLQKGGYNYNVLRFQGNGHDIAAYYLALWPEEKRFLEANVMQGQRRIVDALITDPALPAWRSLSLDNLY